ncbi:MAG: MutS family DNA mismatch repair protein [Ktedonobacteraceae bacterium]
MITKQERLKALENQINRLKKRLHSLNSRSDRYSWIRLAIFLLGALLSVVVFFLLGWLWGVILVAITLITFNIVAYYHRKIDRSITRHKIWLQIKATQVARIQLDWPNIPAVNSKAPPADHPFAIDLDITGERSLHQLINTAVSYEGSQRVCEWLLNTTPDLQTIRKRQVLVQELAPLSRFRNKLTLKSILAAKNVAEQWEGKRLLDWLDTHAAASPRSLRSTLWVATILSALTIILFLFYIFALLGLQFWIISLLLSVGWFYVKRGERGDLFEDAYFLRDAFAQLSTVFEYLETYPYGKHEHLKKLCSPFFSNHEQRPSTLLQRLSRTASAATLEKNQVLWLIVNALLPWDIYVARRLNHYKSLIAALLPTWLDIWFELEALNSLANFAYLNPEYALPELMPVADRASTCLFCGRGLGHPLIPPEQKVVNDFAMNERGEVVIITGSNMSGKSTFLRTLGINLCLAYTGGPVNANAFQASLFKLYTCIKVSDSVTGGYSYFYAEVRRLKGLLTELERASAFPLFFLIDEIFKGTNNRERQIGSRAYIQALVGQNCMGVISTHDLELVKLADTLPHIKNYHFKEDVMDGHMVFDYIVRPGPCPTTNALKIMQMEGLPVDVPV